MILSTENTTDGKFITFFWAVIEDEKKQLLYVNAGSQSSFTY